MKGFIEVTDFEIEAKNAEYLGDFLIKVPQPTSTIKRFEIIKDFMKKHKINFGKFTVAEFRGSNLDEGTDLFRVYIRGCDKKLINIDKIQQVKPYMKEELGTEQIFIGCILSVDLIGDMFVSETYEEIKQKIQEAQEQK